MRGNNMPHTTGGKYKSRLGHKKKKLTSAKAKKMLKEGMAHGESLTKAQKGYFGMVAGGKMPMKMSLQEKVTLQKSKKRRSKKRR